MNPQAYPAVALHDLSKMSAAERSRLLVRSEQDLSQQMDQVRPLLEDVRQRGDAAIVEHTAALDGIDLSQHGLMAQPWEFNQAMNASQPELIDSLHFAADNIRRFHTLQLPQSSWSTEIQPGIFVGERYTPVDSVALYSPLGKGAFPSVTLMTAIPASVAGVPEITVFSPPTQDGLSDPATLVAAKIAGVERVCRAGGALAVAAAAYGTQSIARCIKIEGPGSLWFAAARKLLSDRIDSRLPAGPSESIILADPSANAKLAALDLLIESEHGEDSSVFLLTWSADFAHQTRDHVASYLANMSRQRAGFASQVLSGNHGGIVLVQNAEQAYTFINDYAPEHLQILSTQPEQHLDSIRHASEILLGNLSAGSLANYVLGPNCVLPTAAAAKSHSPLGVRDFLKCSTVARVDESGFHLAAPHTHRLARYEGFDGHANAVSSLRLEALYPVK